MSGNSERMTDIPACPICNKIPAWWEIWSRVGHGWIYSNTTAKEHPEILRNRNWYMGKKLEVGVREGEIDFADFAIGFSHIECESCNRRMDDYFKETTERCLILARARFFNNVGE